MRYLFLIIVLAVVVGILAIASFTNFRLDDEHYDRLKWVALHWDFLVVFLALLVKTFDIAYGIETVAVVGGIGALLGGLLGISTKEYNALAGMTGDEPEDSEVRDEE